MKNYNELSIRSEVITKSIAHSPTRYIFAGFSSEMFSEIDRLNRKIKRLEQIIVNTENALLRGNDDKELLDLLKSAWEMPNMKLCGERSESEPTQG